MNNEQKKFMQRTQWFSWLFLSKVRKMKQWIIENKNKDFFYCEMLKVQWIFIIITKPDRWINFAKSTSKVIEFYKKQHQSGKKTNLMLNYIKKNLVNLYRRCCLITIKNTIEMNRVIYIVITFFFWKETNHPVNRLLFECV